MPVTADVVRLYPSIPHETRLQALKEVLERRKDKKISTNDLVKMLAFVLKSNYFEFNGEVRHQISGTGVGTKLALTYASIFMDEIETNTLIQKSLSLWYGFDISIMFSLFGHMVKKNWKSS